MATDDEEDIVSTPIAIRQKRQFSLDPQNPPSSLRDEGSTYAMGTDFSGMAARAHELGLEQRAARLLKEQESQVSDFSKFLDQMSRADRLRIQLLGRMASRGEIDDAAVDDHGHGLIADLNFFETITAIFKSTVGPSVLYIPMGFAQSGFVFAIPMIFVAYLMVAWSSSNLLTTASQHNMGYSGLMGQAFGQRGERLVEVMIVLQQCGICLTYFVFVAQNLFDILAYLGFEVSMKTLCLCQLLIYVPLTFIRNLQNFACTNLLANACLVFSFVVLISYAIDILEDHDQGVVEKLLWFNESSYYRFVGTSVFLFEGIMALCVPLQQAVREDLRRDFPTTFVTTLGIIIFGYILFGCLNYTAYGATTEIVLSANLPEGNARALVQLAMASAVVFSFPLQLFPAVGILSSFTKTEKIIKKVFGYFLFGFVSLLVYIVRCKQRGYDSVESAETKFEEVPVFSSMWMGNLGRGALVTLLCLIAVCNVDKLDKLVSLLGALLGVPLALILPSCIHLRLSPDAPLWVRRVDIVIISLGAFLATTCSAIVLYTW